MDSFWGAKIGAGTSCREAITCKLSGEAGRGMSGSVQKWQFCVQVVALRQGEHNSSCPYPKNQGYSIRGRADQGIQPIDCDNVDMVNEHGAGTAVHLQTTMACTRMHTFALISQWETPQSCAVLQPSQDLLWHLVPAIPAVAHLTVLFHPQNQGMHGGKKRASPADY
jgi:hypothetical protein